MKSLPRSSAHRIVLLSCLGFSVGLVSCRVVSPSPPTMTTVNVATPDTAPLAPIVKELAETSARQGQQLSDLAQQLHERPPVPVPVARSEPIVVNAPTSPPPAVVISVPAPPASAIIVQPPTATFVYPSLPPAPVSPIAPTGPVRTLSCLMRVTLVLVATGLFILLVLLGLRPVELGNAFAALGKVMPALDVGTENGYKLYADLSAAAPARPEEVIARWCPTTPDAPEPSPRAVDGLRRELVTRMGHEDQQIFNRSSIHILAQTFIFAGFTLLQTSDHLSPFINVALYAIPILGALLSSATILSTNAAHDTLKHLRGIYYRLLKRHPKYILYRPEDRWRQVAGGHGGIRLINFGMMATWIGVLALLTFLAA